MYRSSIFSLIEQKKTKTHTMIDKHNKRRVYISAELNVTEKKRDLPKWTNKFFFDKEHVKQKEKNHKLLEF